MVAIRRQQWREASDHCRRALALRPNSYYALNNLGVALSHIADPIRPSVKSQYLEAMDCLYRAVQVNPTEPLARENLTRTIDRYLLSQHFSGLFFITVILSGHVGVEGLPFCWLGVSLIAAGLLIVRYRRRRALPLVLQDHWRRTRWQHFVKTRAVSRIWTRHKR